MSKPGSPADVNKVGATVQVPASEVKNAWHEFVDRVSQAREEIIVTRYGKPVMKLAPLDELASEMRLFGSLAGSVTAHGDLVAPVDEAWEADA